MKKPTKPLAKTTVVDLAKKKAGRPRLILSDEQWETVIDLMSKYCTQVEVCAELGIDEDTLLKNIRDRGFKNYPDAFKHFSLKGNVSLRRKMFALAMAGDSAMLRHFAKHKLGDIDKVETTHNIGDISAVQQSLAVQEAIARKYQR